MTNKKMPAYSAGFFLLGQLMGCHGFTEVFLI